MRKHWITTEQLLALIAPAPSVGPQPIAIATQVVEQVLHEPRKPLPRDVSAIDAGDDWHYPANTPLGDLAAIRADFISLNEQAALDAGASPSEAFNDTTIGPSHAQLFENVRKALEARPVSIAPTITKLGERLESIAATVAGSGNEHEGIRSNAILRYSDCPDMAWLATIDDDIFACVELCDELAAQARGGWPVGGPDTTS